MERKFPGIPFTADSQYYSDRSIVFVRWTDGPMNGEVEQAVSWMESCQFGDFARYGFKWGYEYEGRKYCGADQINLRRELTAERKAIIHRHLQQTRQPIFDRGYFPFDYEEAEQELIDSGLLDQVSGQEAKPVTGVVIPFPVKAAAEPLTDEQQFKRDILLNLAPEIVIPADQIESGEDIDYWFRAIAEKLYRSQS